MQRHRTPITVAVALAVGVISLGAPAGPINTDVAFTPRKGGGTLRLQYVYSEARPSGRLRSLRVQTGAATIAYGVTRDLALIVRAPYHERRRRVWVDDVGIVGRGDRGFGDVTVLAKYRFWQRDTRPGETLRLAAVGGLNIRSGDTAFTSDSYDPVVGAVFTWFRDRHHFAADLLYQFNTGGGERGHDVLRYDVSYSYRLYPERYDLDHTWEIDAVAELNGRYGADGSHQVFLSPGLQFIAERFTIEASIQLPVIQHLENGAPDSEYRLVAGVRYRW